MKKDGIPPRRTGCSVVQLLPATWEARVRFPASASKKNFVQTPIFRFARTQNIKIRWTVNTMWFYIIFLSVCYFILQACSFIGVIRVTSPIDINVQTRSLLASFVDGFFCFTGWFIFYKTKCLQIWNIADTSIAVTSIDFKLLSCL